MPLYQVYHSYSLNQEQKQKLATQITNLHCTTFTTPSFFVHVRFIQEDARSNDYFMAGKPHAANSNRIEGVVRTSASRTKADFDRLGEKIEAAWYDAVESSSVQATALERDKEGRRLVMVVFTPMITIREGGMAISEAGKESDWLKDHLPYIKEMGQEEGIKDFEDMVKELETREDLKGWMQ
ncbi:Glycerol kinase [Elsinoe australis]|uniref:Glycerol kinase n=1 Tax=Elsinoe australis TaxID=40998 RepID=A0A2P8A7N5_9PEZI|nr:Glycerol kinase [Elsinoe australis]